MLHHQFHQEEVNFSINDLWYLLLIMKLIIFFVQKIKGDVKMSDENLEDFDIPDVDGPPPPVPPRGGNLLIEPYLIIFHDT